MTQIWHQTFDPQRLRYSLGLAYADDSYIAISCEMKDYATAKEKLEKKLSSHFDWLKSLGMVVNPTKTRVQNFPSLQS